ncbi:MAG: hypothetical protein FDX21_09375 [Chlorobium sp.]|nr:MAG: hypothetical protein FDX21_09375 [Chlorobium sp.]
MKTEIKLALIGGVVTIIAAVLPVVLGWYGPSSSDKEKSSPAQVVQSSPADKANPGNATTTSGSKVNTGLLSRIATIDKAKRSNFAALSAIIRNRDLQAAKASPAFRKLVQDRYGKEIEQLDRRQMLTFWPEMSRYLAAQQRPVAK